LTSPLVCAKVVLGRKQEIRMNKNCRLIDINISVLDAIFLLSEENPGAIRVLVQMSGAAETVDPDNFAGPFGPMLNLDSQGIYGSNIWLLFKDICGECIPKTLAVLRGVQLGIVDEATVHAALDLANVRNPIGFNPDEVWAKVCLRLPNFQKKEQEATVKA
jgi:hypothetical protein